MLTAEAAILIDLDSVRIVLLVLCRVIVALLAFAAREGNFDSHYFRPFLSSRYPDRSARAEHLR